jgi:hypothetical protein
MNPRLTRELQTVAAMIECYCSGVHGCGDPLCVQCRELLDYATTRLERCRFGGAKPVCANCPVHCYQARMRDEIKRVMRYAGPRMLWRHPILTLRHFLDSRRPVPAITR